MLGRKKKIIFSLIMIFIILIIIEGFSFLFFHIFYKRFTFYDFSKYLISSKKIKWNQSIYNKEFGWDWHFETKYGERPIPTYYSESLLSSFGDSFTFCDTVSNNETWQSYLSGEIHENCFNFGVSAYGVDQAYLKFLKIFSKIKTPIVTLGLITENINRIVNVYRPFYYQETGISLTKPRFTINAGKLVLIPNPITKREDVKLLKKPSFLAKIGSKDWWYNRDNYPYFSFPYSFILLNKRFYMEVYYGKGDRRINDMNPRPWENLWKNKEAKELLFKIIDTFILNAKKNNAIPIILIMPLKQEVIYTYTTNYSGDSINMLINHCKKNGYYYFNGVKALADNVKSLDSIPPLFKAHLTAQGNKLFASQFKLFLKKEKLLSLPKKHFSSSALTK